MSRSITYLNYAIFRIKFKRASGDRFPHATMNILPLAIRSDGLAVIQCVTIDPPGPSSVGRLSNEVCMMMPFELLSNHLVVRFL